MSVESFTIEAWTYLAIDIVVVAIRTLARWRQMGIRGLAPDDYLMILAIVSLLASASPRKRAFLPLMRYSKHRRESLMHIQDEKQANAIKLSIHPRSAAIHSRDGNCTLCWRVLARVSQQWVCFHRAR